MVGIFSWCFCSSGDIYPIKEGGFRLIGHATSHDAPLTADWQPFRFPLENPFELKGWESGRDAPPGKFLALPTTGEEMENRFVFKTLIAIQTRWRHCARSLDAMRSKGERHYWGGTIKCIKTMDDVI